MAILQVIKGGNAGHCYELTSNDSVLGRYPFCEVVLPSHTVSRQHARIVRTGDNFYIEDLNSLNGTFLNGERVRKRTLLKDQDRIRIYEILLLFSTGKPAASGTPGKPTKAQVAETHVFKGDEQQEQQEDEPQAPAIVVSLRELKPGESTLSHSKLKTVLEATRSLGGCTDLDTLLPMVLDALFQVFPQSGRGHVLLAKKEGSLVPKSSKHRSEQEEEEVAAATFGPISHGLAARAAAECIAILSGGAVEGGTQSVLDAPAPSTMCAPLLGPSRTTLGVLQLETDAGDTRFGPEDLDLLVCFGMIAGQAVEYALLLAGP